MEDLLTSCVFDALRYSESHRALIHWVQEARTHTGKFPFRVLSEHSNVNIRFWPALTSNETYGCIPDVILEIDNAVILVEAKYRSGKSSFADDLDNKATDQLAREWDALLDVLQEEVSERVPYLLYLTADVGFPKEEIMSSLKNVKRSIQLANENFCWLSWRHLFRFLEDQKRPSLIDLRTLLEKLDLFMFEGVRDFRQPGCGKWTFDHLNDPWWLRDFPFVEIGWRFNNDKR